jgi:putative transcriptional regulator
MSSSSSLAPSLLLSMPQLVDPNFNRTVVLLCKHNEEGAFGLVLNRPLATAGPIVVEVRAPGPEMEPSTEMSEHELEVWVGGPQLDSDGHGDLSEETGVRIVEGLHLPRRPTCCAGCSAADAHTPVVGYSGWSGPAEAELEASAWPSATSIPT